MPFSALQATPPPSTSNAAAQRLLEQLIQSGAPGTSLEALQAQVRDLARQSIDLRAQRDVVRRQIDVTSQSDARARFVDQKRQLDNQIVQVDVQLASAKAQLASRLGVSPDQVTSSGTIEVRPPFIQRPGPDPDMIVGMTFTLLIAIALPLSIAYARRVWRGAAKGAAAPKSDESAQRFERLEHAVDAIAIEIERVAEGQRFVTKIMTDRPQAAPAQVLAPKVDVSDAALGEAKPFLALGAGPLEPIRVAERQAVKQSVTPH